MARISTSMKDILQDPRYPDFVARYHADPLRFAVEATGFIPSADQARLFRGISSPRALVSVVSGTGCFAKGTMMMRSDGSAVAVEDVRVGDRLMGPDGASVRNVLELKRGRETMYRFTYMDGSSHVFNESHILTLAPGAKYTALGKTDIVNVTVRDWLKWPKTRKERYYAYRSKVVQFERHEEPLPVPPYILGLWLGDGSSHKPQLTTMDPEVDAAFTEWAESIGCTVSRSVNSKKSWCVYAARLKGTAQENPATGALRAAGVWGNKHIPDAYKFASIEDRAQLLAGIVDTDGYFDGTNFVVVQKDEAMARNVEWIARSIGCHATVRSTQKTCQNTGRSGFYWSVSISRNTNLIPVRVPRRKPAEGRKQRPHLNFGIRSVECLGEGDYYGFVLDGDHRFLAHDFTVLHNTGKTASFARIALWHLLCFPVATYEGKTEIGSNTYIGAPLIQQVADGVWKEMKDALIAIKNGPHAWIADYFTISKTRVVVKGYEAQWFITQIAMAKGESIGVAGKHRYWQLIIIDEAAGVPDEHFNVIQGTQTQGGNRTLLASQGARSAGFFYETHHTLAKENGGSWLNLRFNSEEAPWVTSEWLADRALESGGRNSVEYQVRVLGLFAQSSANVLLTRDVLDRAFEPRQIINPDEPWGYLILCDVGLGEYRDDSVVIVAKVMGNGDFGKDARRVEFVEIPIASNDKQVPDLTGDLVNLFGRLPNATLAVDAGGIGAVVVKELERQNIPVIPINWGAPCFSSEYKKRFYNKRACAMVRFRDAVRDGRVVLPQGISRRLREKILTEGTRLPYHFSEAGSLRYVMDSKEDMRRQGIKSPDLIDAMAFAFLEGMNYMAAGTDTGGEHETAANRAAREAAELFADI